MWELAHSLQALRDPSRAAIHLPWLRSLSGRIGDLDLGPIIAHRARRLTDGGPAALFEDLLPGACAGAETGSRSTSASPATANWVVAGC